MTRYAILDRPALLATTVETLSPQDIINAIKMVELLDRLMTDMAACRKTTGDLSVDLALASLPCERAVGFTDAPNYTGHIGTAAQFTQRLLSSEDQDVLMYEFNSWLIKPNRQEFANEAMGLLTQALIIHRRNVRSAHGF